MGVPEFAVLVFLCAQVAVVVLMEVAEDTDREEGRPVKHQVGDPIVPAFLFEQRKVRGLMSQHQQGVLTSANKDHSAQVERKTPEAFTRATAAAIPTHSTT